MARSAGLGGGGQAPKPTQHPGHPAPWSYTRLEGFPCPGEGQMGLAELGHLHHQTLLPAAQAVLSDAGQNHARASTQHWVSSRCPQAARTGESIPLTRGGRSRGRGQLASHYLWDTEPAPQPQTGEKTHHRVARRVEQKERRVF